MQPIRLLLAHAGVEYEDKRLKMEERDSWLAEKPNLGLDFPNVSAMFFFIYFIRRLQVYWLSYCRAQLPYYMDGDVKLSQTFAILKYLGRKHGLAPVTDAEQIRVDLIEAEAMDVRSGWSKLCYSPDFVRISFHYI